MNNNATKKKLALNKTSLRELTVSEWEMVGGGAGFITEDACSAACATAFCTGGCISANNCTLGSCLCPTPTQITCLCTTNCYTNTCPP